MESMNVVKDGHSPIGASVCHRFWECPGSVELIKKTPLQPTSRPAAEGTVAHMIGDTYLNAFKSNKSGRALGLLSMIGTTTMEDDHEIEITEEMIEAVSTYINTIRKEVDKIGTNPSFLSVEEQFQLDVDPEAWGRNDASLYIPFEELHIWDYKHGKGVVVEVPWNKQLMYYALGALQGKEVQRVVTHIVQPRAYHPDGPIRSFTYTMTDLKAFEIGLKVAIKKTREPNAEVKSGKHCRFCPAISFCPALKKEANQIAEKTFDVVKANEFNVDDMLKFLDMKDRVKEFFEKVIGYLTSEAERGVDIPGHKLVRTRTHRRWKSETRVISKFRGELGDKMFAPSKLKTPAQLEKLLKKGELAGYMEKPEGGLVLVPDSDNRETVKSSAALDFKNV